MRGDIVEWISGELRFYLFVAAHQPFVSDFTQRYFSTAEGDDHNLLTTTLGTNAATLRTDLTLLLREWAKATLSGRSWRDALVTAINVSISYSRHHSWSNSPGVHRSEMRRLSHYM